MLTLTELQRELPNDQLLPAEFATSAYWTETRVPKYAFITVIACVPNQEHMIVTVARDSFSENLAAAIIRFVREYPGDIDWSRPVQLLTGFHQSGFAFDNILLTGPGDGALFESSSVNSICFRADPVFRGEFSGNETLELVGLIKRLNARTADWNRSPSPQVWIYLSNAKHGTKRGLTNLTNALREMKAIPEGSVYMELENYCGDVRTVTRLDKNLGIRSAATSHVENVAAERAEDWLANFVTAYCAQTMSESPLPSLQGQPELVIFLWDSCRDRKIESSELLTVSLVRALDEFDRLSQQDGCFIGFVRNGETLQFIWNEDGTLDADIPFPNRNGSLQRRGTADELRSLIEDFANGTPVEQFKDFSFQRWITTE